MDNTLFAWHLGVVNLITVEILYFLSSWYENLGELCMYVERVCMSAAFGLIWLKFGQIVVG